MAGVELERVAEIIVEASDGRWRGSGYEVAAGTVLTAAHVVARASSVRVRFNADQADERDLETVVSFANSSADIAILTFAPGHSEDRLVPVEFGTIQQQVQVATCTAVGFPRFKLRDDPPDRGQSASRYRDCHQANGSVAPLSGIREGTFEFNVLPPEREADPARSPWEGMSGAPLWCDGRIVGLISLQHRSEGLNRLAATRVTQWYALLPNQQLQRLRELTGLPAGRSDLATVGGAPPEAAETHDRSGDVSYKGATIHAVNFVGRDSYGAGRPQRESQS